MLLELLWKPANFCDTDSDSWIQTLLATNIFRHTELSCTTLTRTVSKLQRKVTEVHLEFDWRGRRRCRSTLAVRCWLGRRGRRCSLVLYVNGCLKAGTQIWSALHHRAEIGWVLRSKVGQLLQRNFVKTAVQRRRAGVGITEECYEQRNEKRHQVDSYPTNNQTWPL